MSDNRQIASSSGSGFCFLLTILFVILKLTGVITWSWFWVLSPLWIGLAIVISLLVLFFVFMIFAFIAKTIFDR